ncbi:UNKNOWN [Stylonychia lemnae]|uniref:Lipoprotein n=1 Tax=Stylonychia lemnae TaxID=5949 RepID=A0A078A176_STYLE|nr:UNKNOWN [Stylonychia lemnae]|eukprot:CDW76006.1 UNKNOWN [Stylonychia lemnae]
MKFKIRILILAYILRQAQFQTPSALWYLDTPTGTDYVKNEYNGGLPQWHLDQNGLGLGSPGRFVGNGIYVEGSQLACTHAGAGDTIDVDKDFTVDMWIYANSFDDYGIILCKYYDLGTYVNERFCIGHTISGRIHIRINYYSYNYGNAVYLYEPYDCDIELGWNHLTVAFKRVSCSSPSNCNTQIICYAQTDTGKVTTDTAMAYLDMDDDPSNRGFLCIGGTVGTTFNGGAGLYYEFKGIVGQVAFYGGTILTQAQSLALQSTNCQKMCKICRPVGTAPYECFQQQSGNWHQYDFRQSVYPTNFVQPDGSGGGRNLYVDPNFSQSPIYTHKEGFYFDTTWAGQSQYIVSKISTAFPSSAVKSFTLEAWIRPTNGLQNMNIFEKEYSIGNDYLLWGFSTLNYMFIRIGSYTVPSYYCGTPANNEWHYAAVSILQKNENYELVCYKFDTQTTQCHSIYNVYTEYGTSTLQIGQGFRGWIRDINVTDYAKVDLDLSRVTQTSACLANENSNTCSRCPIQSGQCIPDCNYGYYVNSTTKSCTICYANCRSCWGGYHDNCYSCLKTPISWSFDYDRRCKSACGDSVKDDYEVCEDGNTKNGDGCSSTCTEETGFSCFGGSFNKVDTCRFKCGDGLLSGSEKCDDGNSVRGDGCDLLCNIETGFQCSGAPSVCTPICGDGKKIGNEVCDDGNTATGDGCSNLCKIETGFNCTGGNVNGKDTCQELCGDGKDFQKYGCDDGNLVNNDGCDQNCRVETGYTCSGGSFAIKDTCTEICGDSRLMKKTATSCDDGNIVSGDGCSLTCLIETGFQCAGGSPYTKDTCSEICGDGKNFGKYSCDDGNTVDGDGCHSDCSIEIGFQCSGGTSTTPDTCSEVCGDGRNFGTYACDDGNNEDGDGCRANCTIEPKYYCTKGDKYTKSKCYITCNGIREFKDMCDDGNLVNGDGCDYCCHREVGFVCSGGSMVSGDVCQEACGDGRKMNYLECDDANQVSGDGCSSTCSIETGFYCTGGTLFTPDICFEICGDGKNFGNYECDDGNVGNNDGCSSQCYIEKGFTCTAGNSTTKSVCEEICGDGKNMNSFLDQCDDGNTVNGDGCMKNCTIETGYTCSQGNPYVPDLCHEICGDGYNFGKFECDDGNTQDQDGCSSYCSIEDGWTCSGGNTLQPDTCKPKSSPMITNAFISKNNQLITLEFSEPVIMLSSWNLTNAWTIDISGPFGRENYKFTWNVTRVSLYKNALYQGHTILNIDFNCENQLFGGKVERIVINFNKREFIKGYSSNSQMSNSSAFIYPYGQDQQSSANKENGFPDLVDQLVISLIYSSFGVGFISAFSGYSMMNVWIMTYGVQQIYFFPMNNLYVPSSLTTFVKNLNFAVPQSQILAYICVAGMVNNTQFEITNEVPSQTYYKMGLESTAFLQTGADVLSVMICMFILNMCIEIIRLAFEDNVELNNSMTRIKSAIIPGYLTFAFAKLALTTHLNIAFTNFDDSQATVSSIFALALGSFCWAYMLYMGYQAIQFYKEMKQLKLQYPDQSHDILRDLTYFKGNVLFQDYSTTSYIYPITIFYPCIMQLRQLISAILIVSNDYQEQLKGQMLISLICMTSSLVIQPFTSPLMNAQLIFNEMGIFLIYMQAHQFIPKTLIAQNDQTSAAKLFVMMIIGIVGVNACFVIFTKVTQIAKCKSVARAKPNKSKMSPDQKQTVKIQPIQQQLSARPLVQNDTPISAKDQIQAVQSAKNISSAKPIQYLIEQKKLEQRMKEQQQTQKNLKKQQKSASNKTQSEYSYYDEEDAEDSNYEESKSYYGETSRNIKDKR